MAGIEDIGGLLREAFAPAEERLPRAFVLLLSRLEASEAKLASGLSEAEFKAMLTAVVPQLRARARSLTRGQASADDLVQDTLARAWAKRGSFRAGTRFDAWTYTILRNLFFSQSRRNRFRGEWDERTAEATLAAAADQEHRVHLADLEQALQRLPAAQREALMLVGADQLSYEEAAEACDIKIGTIKSRVSRAREALLRLIDGDETPEPA